MNITAMRLAIAAGLIVLVHVGISVGRSVFVPITEDSKLKLADLPREFPPPNAKGVREETLRWVGIDEALNDSLFKATESDSVVERSYRHENGRRVQMHMAFFKKPNRGVFHSPRNCYRSQGFRPIEEHMVPLKVPGRPDIEVPVGLWEKENEQVLVLFWYEVGDKVLFERSGLLWMQLKMFGRGEWPPMYKVLLSVPKTDDNAEKDLIDLAGQIRQWLGQTQAAPPAAGS